MTMHSISWNIVLFFCFALTTAHVARSSDGYIDDLRPPLIEVASFILAMGQHEDEINVISDDVALFNGTQSFVFQDNNNNCAFRLKTPDITIRIDFSSMNGTYLITDNCNTIFGSTICNPRIIVYGVEAYCVKSASSPDITSFTSEQCRFHYTAYGNSYTIHRIERAFNYIYTNYCSTLQQKPY